MTKKIVIASDSFKDCLSSLDVSQNLKEGILLSMPKAEISLFPVADGGEGTASCVHWHRGGVWKEVLVNDPLHRKIKAKYLVLEQEKTSVIELAGASGLELLEKDERDALKTSTFGTGELLKDALDSGLNKIILTIGGSATVDGGTGIASVLGFRFYDKDGKELLPSGQMNNRLARIDSSMKHPGLSKAEIIIACDVSNVLNGKEGAARVFGPQKGANKDAVRKLEDGLKNLSRLILEDTGFDADKNPGTGAAGGAAMFLLAYGKGVLKNGFEIVDKLTGFSETVKNNEIVITGEGKLDTQTAYGKVVASISKITSLQKKNLILVAGVAEGSKPELKKQYGASAVYSLAELAKDIDDSILNSKKYLIKTGEMISQSI